MCECENEDKCVNPEELEPIIEEFAGQRWALIPLLQKVQDKYGYIPPETMAPIARAIGLFPSQVQGVVSFYSQFYTTKRGRNIVRVCRGTACHVKGSGSVLSIVKQKLGIDEDETTQDYNFTLETVACLGACFLAPTMLVNREYYGKLAPSRVSSVLQQYEPKTKEAGNGET